MALNNNMGPLISSSSYINSTLRSFSNQLKVSHLNCRSITPKLDELKLILKNNPLDIFSVSETWLSNVVSDRAVAMPGFKLCRNDRSSRGGGVALYISNKLKYKYVFKISDSNACESLFVELYFGNATLLLGVVYLRNGDLVSFENYHRNLFVKYTNIIISGDFNCNMFDSIKSNSLRSLCTRCSLSVIHNSRPTHYDIARDSSSLIDFFLVSKIESCCYSDQVQCPYVSDHALIFGSFVFRVEDLQEFVEFRDFNNINWDGLLSFASNFDLSLFFSSNDVDTKCTIISSLFDSFLSYVPLTRRRIRCENDSWMDSRTITYARSLRDLAFSAFRLNRSSDNWRIYCKLRNKAKSVIRREKRKHFSRLFNGLDSGGMWKVLRGSGCVGNDDVVCDYNAGDLNDFFVGGTNFDNDEHFNFDFDDSVNSFSFRCVNELELLEALNRVRSRSVGVDSISIKFIKIVFPYISSLILDFVNTILTTSVFPLAWKTARVVPIPKTKVVRGLDDFRPISILPALSKVVEHLLKNQILQSDFISISESQFAFRQGYNTTSLLLKLTDDIRCNVNNNKLSVLVSLDLSKAFNSIDHGKMISKLRNEFNFSKPACRLVMSYLCGRSQFVALNNDISSLRSLYSGVPQGSVLGPLLFILYINDLPRLVNSRGCQSFLFADDVFLLFDGNRRFTELLEGNVNCSLDRVLQWVTENSLSLNSSKSKAVMFGLSNRVNFDLDVFLGEDRIELVNQLRCLGIVLDNSLSFESHINIVCGRVWGALRKMYSTNIFIPFSVKQKIAHAVLMSQVLYGLEVVSGTIGVNFIKLKRVVNAIVRFIYNVRRRDHISEYVRRFLGCSFNEFVKYRILYFFHKVMKSGKPLLLRNNFVFTRSTRNPQLHISRIRNSTFERSFMIRVARCWNPLPYGLRIFSQSNNVFKLKILDYFNSFV